MATDTTSDPNPNAPRYALYRDPQVLDNTTYLHKKLAPLTDYSVAARMASAHINANEIVRCATDFVVVFVDAGEADGKRVVQPIVLFGTQLGENLYVDGTRWSASYLPDYIRRYPFWLNDNAKVMIDAAWPGISDTEGEPLFNPDGRPAPRLAEAMRFIDHYTAEAQRTFAICGRLVELELFDPVIGGGTLPDGTKVEIQGLLVISPQRMRALPDAVVIELHRSGVLEMLSAHLLSLGLMPRLLERKAQRVSAA